MELYTISMYVSEAENCMEPFVSSDEVIPVFSGTFLIASPADDFT
jgi:hypothetical protein